MKRVLMIFLSILSGLFLLFGIMGIAVFINEKDIAALIFFTIWSILGAFLFVFFLKRSRIRKAKHTKRNSARNRNHNKSPHQMREKEFCERSF